MTKPSINLVTTRDPPLEEHLRLQKRLKLAFQNSMPIPVATNTCPMRRSKTQLRGSWAST